MDNDVLQGKWREFKGMVREKWGALTDNDVEEINGNREQLLGKLQQRYGMARQRAIDEVNTWLDDVNRDIDRS